MGVVGRFVKYFKTPLSFCCCVVFSKRSRPCLPTVCARSSCTNLALLSPNAADKTLDNTVTRSIFFTKHYYFPTSWLNVLLTLHVVNGYYSLAIHSWTFGTKCRYHKLCCWGTRDINCCGLRVTFKMAASTSFDTFDMNDSNTDNGLSFRFVECISASCFALQTSRLNVKVKLYCVLCRCHFMWNLMLNAKIETSLENFG